MMTRVFDEVTLSKKRSGKCNACDRRTTRTTKVSQMINPFNKNAQGLPKTREEIQGELAVELARDLKSPLCCTACERS